MLLVNIASELRWRLYECVGPSQVPAAPPAGFTPFRMHPYRAQCGSLGDRSSQLERRAVVLNFELEAGRKHAAFESAVVAEPATTVVADLSLSVSTSRSG